MKLGEKEELDASGRSAEAAMARKKEGSRNGNTPRPSLTPRTHESSRNRKPSARGRRGGEGGCSQAPPSGA